MSSGYDPKGPIFISYRQSDGRPYAELLDNYLRAGGLVPWRDLVDLPPGETAQRVTEAFDEGISNAILVVTPELLDSQFVPEVEVPKLFALDEDSGDGRPFHLLVLNTRHKPGHEDQIDVHAPDKLLKRTENWPPSDANGVRAGVLRNLKQYALLDRRGELRQLYADLLDARLAARVAELADKEVTIHTQSRPEGSARSRLAGVTRSRHLAKNPDDPYDLIVRLRQDRVTGVPSELGMVSLQQTLPLLVDALYAHGVEKVKVIAAGHSVLLWALGAALPMTRMKGGSVQAEDIGEHVWGEGRGRVSAEQQSNRTPCSECGRELFPPEGEKPEDPREFHACFDPPISSFNADNVPQDRLTRAVVLLQVAGRANMKAFDRIADALPDLHAKIVVSLKPRIPDTTTITSGEGGRLAGEIMDGLRELVNKVGIDEFHVVSAAPTAMALLLGRNSNTLNLVLYEWGSGGQDGNREYVPLARIQPGMPGGPITEVFPRRQSWKAGEITEFVNLTPHALNLIQDEECVYSWPAASEDEWCRIEESLDPVDPLEHRDPAKGDVEVPVFQVTEGGVVNHPPRVEGRGYIVPRLTATASSRNDFFFPIKQTRDSKGQINGSEALGQYSGRDLHTTKLLDLLEDDCPNCGHLTGRRTPTAAPAEVSEQPEME